MNFLVFIGLISEILAIIQEDTCKNISCSLLISSHNCGLLSLVNYFTKNGTKNACNIFNIELCYLGMHHFGMFI